jgi:hypothetical protein
MDYYAGCRLGFIVTQPWLQQDKGRMSGHDQELKKSEVGLPPVRHPDVS